MLHTKARGNNVIRIFEALHVILVTNKLIQSILTNSFRVFIPVVQIRLQLTLLVNVAKRPESLLVEGVFLVLLSKRTPIVINSIPDSLANVFDGQRIIAVVVQLGRIRILNCHCVLDALGHIFVFGAFDSQQSERHGVDVILRRKNVVWIILIQYGQSDVLPLFQQVHIVFGRDLHVIDNLRLLPQKVVAVVLAHSIPNPI